ncbi:MYCBP-associated protein [Habropoda laboriosa]|uniref:MYCBP-associated protein n=1 Tax=Habropoda laboriosa TaxID=597456 RepID=A0A0L7R4N8_9HYME|nr:PREDICTED: MYCBP-associated protein-like [Habropoda laboriosa]KOC65731.1 MYCBP-associated protein [Habropoda laboriosa]
MDYARKIGKSDKPKKWVKQFTPSASSHDGLISPDTVYPEDRRLLNWKTWLKRHENQYERIKATTNRHQNDQILTSCERVRAQVEMRNLMDYATAPVPIVPDKHRGGPEFWRTPETLPKRNSCLPDIAFTPSKKELNVTPELTHVDLPELIEKEKSLSGLRSKEPLWKRSQYLAKRKGELSKEIERLLAKEPDTKDLAIKNRTIPKKETLRRIPPITVSGVENEPEEESCRDGYPEQAIVLKIQDREIVWERPDSRDEHAKADPITWSFTFAGRINRRTEKEIVLENKGNRVIIYHWRDTECQSKFIPLKRRASPFFFNKTKGVILPGQFVRLQIWFKSRNSGVSTEYWKLITSPVLCSSPLIFRLWGCAETVNVRTAAKFNSVRIVDRYLDGCVGQTVAREIMEDIMEKVGSFEYPQPAYGSLFFESEIFTLKNPLCFYSPSVLMEFHNIYYAVTNQTERRWNMSLMDLREILLEDRKHGNLLSQFSELYKECLKPTLYRFVPFDKHEAVYNFLCSFFNLFEMESEFARSGCFGKECKETSGTASEDNSTESMIERSNASRVKRISCLSSRLQRNQVEEIRETSVSVTDDQAYKEIFFQRIYNLLGVTVVRVFATIESFNNLNEPDK